MQGSDSHRGYDGGAVRVDKLRQTQHEVTLHHTEEEDCQASNETKGTKTARQPEKVNLPWQPYAKG